MENKEIASVLKLVGQLMELHDENKFKVRSYSNASFQVGRFAQPLKDMDPADLVNVPGVGKNLVPKIEELLETGEMTYLQQWIELTPPGVIQMLGIKGIGPSKIKTIWKDLEAESIGELLYACNENRLVDLKGFGAKTQAQVKSSIEFMMENSRKFHYASVEKTIQEIVDQVLEANPGSLVSETGGALRRDPVLDKLEFVVSNASSIPSYPDAKIDVAFHEVETDQFEREVFVRSCAKEHLDELPSTEGQSPEDIYSANGKPFIVPEMRNGGNEFEWAATHEPSDLIVDADLMGCLHNHTTYSDGIHTLRQMAEFLKSEGYAYFGVSDHSQTAVYAGGLREDDILEQHAEIDGLNAELAPFKILKGIESDILMNGSLDYPASVLASFDFVVASVHSVLKMDEQTATERLVAAIENPYTSILGHPTGRLLLSRPGYPIDHKKVIEACAANGVAMELNANPMRLDIDWTWIPYCMEKGVKVSINPDAHRMEGVDHMRFGVMSARKGGLTKELCLNALSLDELETYFRSR